MSFTYLLVAVCEPESLTLAIPAFQTNSEGQTRAKLEFALGQIRRERQRRAGRGNTTALESRAGTDAMHVKRRKPGLKTKQGTDFVVDAGKVRPVCNVESFRRDDQIYLLAQLVLPGQARIE